MQFSVLINQSRAVEWGLNAQQAMLFAFVFNAPTWATAVEIDGTAYCHISKSKVVEEMPLLTDKPDTVYRLLRQLCDKGLVRMSSIGHKTLVAITPKGALWNTSEKSPNHGKKSDVRKEIRDAEKSPLNHGEISDQTSEKSPTDHITNNQITKIKKTPPVSPRGGPPERYPPDFEIAWSSYPRRAGSNPKTKAFAAWRARIRSGVDPGTMLAGVRRYARFIDATGKTRTEFVMQGQRFFGPDEHYLNDWTPPAGGGHENRSNGSNHGPGQRLSLVDQVRQANGFGPDPGGEGACLDGEVVGRHD